MNIAEPEELGKVAEDGSYGRMARLIHGIPKTYLYGGILFLSCAACFGLGVLEGRQEGQGGITITEISTTSPAFVAAAQTARAAEAEPQTLPAGGEVVASKDGSKYYLPWCGTVKRIKEENKVWFPSREAAEAAGYAPAANCKGL